MCLEEDAHQLLSKNPLVGQDSTCSSKQCNDTDLAAAKGKPLAADKGQLGFLRPKGCDPLNLQHRGLLGKPGGLGMHVHCRQIKGAISCMSCHVGSFLARDLQQLLHRFDIALVVEREKH